MPRSERPNPYQYAFDFAAQPLEISQHVRLVKEPYVVRQPADAAWYLLNHVFVPFAQFKQEHLFVCAVSRRRSIGYQIPCRKESKTYKPSHLSGTGN